MKLLQEFKYIRFRWSDLFLLLGFLAFFVFMLFGQQYMYRQDPSVCILNIWAGTGVFLAGLAFFGIYLFLESKRGNLPHPYLFALLFIVIFTGTISIFAQPTSLEVFDGRIVELSIIHKFIFTYEMILIVLFIFSSYFVFSKRFPSYKTSLLSISYATFIFLLVVAIYSYIKESSCFPDFFKVLFGYVEGREYPPMIKSFLLNSNAVGMAMLIGVMLCYICHAIKPRWWYHVLAFYFYMHIIFSFCRTSFIIATAIMNFYTYYWCISNLKNKKVSSIIGIVLYSLVLITVATVSLVAYNVEEFMPHFEIAIKKCTNFSSMYSREEIWKHSWDLLTDGHWRLGRGFGNFNLFLTYSFEHVQAYTLPSHQGFLAIIGEGGLVFLFTYIALLVYTVKVAIKCVKKDLRITIAISLAIVGFFFYTFVETIQYLLYIFIYLLLVVYQVQNKKVIQQE